MLEKDHKHHGSNPDEEIPTATTTTNDTAISYQADIDAALDARNQGQDLPTAAEVEGSRLSRGQVFQQKLPKLRSLRRQLRNSPMYDFPQCIFYFILS
jgi:hypothetical protein